MKKFKVKPEYAKAAAKLIGWEAVSYDFQEDDVLYRKLKEYNVFDYFCEEVIPVVEPWVEPMIYISTTNGTDAADGFDMIRLFMRMHSWSRYYNKLDNFVAYWNDITTQPKFGIEITTVNSCRRATVNCWKNSNRNLFQISVGTRERADEMLKYFKDDIEKLINDKLL